MKKMFLIVLLMPPGLFFSCKQGVEDPKAVLSQFFEAVAKKDIDKARKLATADSKSTIDLIEQAIKMSKDSKEIEKFNLKSMELGDARIDGTNATIPVKAINSGETLDYSLKKENDGWKVDLDVSAMMNTFMEKMYEKAINPADSIDKIIQVLKNLKHEEVKNGRSEEASIIDSVNKELKKVDKQ